MPRKTKKQLLAEEIVERLKLEYPDAECSLEYDEAWKLLVSVRLALSAQQSPPLVVVFLFF